MERSGQRQGLAGVGVGAGLEQRVHAIHGRLTLRGGGEQQRRHARGERRVVLGEPGIHTIRGGDRTPAAAAAATATILERARVLLVHF